MRNCNQLQSLSSDWILQYRNYNSGAFVIRVSALNNGAPIHQVSSTTQQSCVHMLLSASAIPDHILDLFLSHEPNRK